MHFFCEMLDHLKPLQSIELGRKRLSAQAEPLVIHSQKVDNTYSEDALWCQKKRRV